MNHEQVLTSLRQVLGAQDVVTDTAELDFHSTDVYRSGERPLVLIRPRSTESLSAALKAIAPSGLPVVPRGGGMSYTDGYLPSRPHSIMVDLLQLRQVRRIEPEDNFVTVECGATWQALHDALAPHGVRTPYWGPLSGLRSSIGGALSQGSIFLGSGRHGTAAESVIGLEVVLVDGTVLHLGSHANRHGEPFMRQYGPDLMGLFLSDTGALGIKTAATFRLVRPEPEARYLSFSFDRHPEFFAAMAEVARQDLVSEQFGFDPGLQAQRMKRASLAEDVKALGKVMQAAGGGLKGLKEGASIVLAGRGFLKDGSFSAHVSLDGRDARDADAKADRVRQIMARGGREVENSVPKVMRANPFAEVNSMLGPNGERWVPVHGIVAFSQASGLFEALENVFAAHESACAQYQIDHGYLCCTVSGTGMLIEPCLYWPDARNGFHTRILAKDYLDKLPVHPANPAASAAVHSLRSDLARCLLQKGAVSFQLGKFYPYQESLHPSAAQVLRSIKQLFDPQGRMNPGSLGLAR
jgi:FAD/FMN-containing dehydrogenase